MSHNRLTHVFGAFDRHNLGDMLFAHVVEALLPDHELTFAGLVDRDLTPWGGHKVQALPRLAAADRTANLIVAGGEVFTCNAFEAAVMVLPPDEAEAAAIRFERAPEGRMAWAQQVLGTDRLAPYAPGKSALRRPSRLIYNAVGGVDLPVVDAQLRAEVAAALEEADFVGVRDRATQQALAGMGIDSVLMPDGAALVAELFGERIREFGLRGEPADVRAAFPSGHVAIQFSADCADDATLRTLARELDAAAAKTGLGIVFFRAGTAPWHDALEPYRRTCRRMQTRRVHIFESANVWDICALIAESRAFAGTSLHGRIVATAFGLPAVTFLPPHPADSAQSKQRAYIDTWDASHPDAMVSLEDFGAALVRAAAADLEERRLRATGIARAAREYCSRWLALLAS